MHTKSTNFSVFRLRSYKGVWMFLVVWACSFILPLTSSAQQPTATINALSGPVLVNGQAQSQGTVLGAGDILETQSGASVALTLSDGSQLMVGENTRIDIAELTQTATGARVSSLKLLYGWLRARLSPGHQKDGSAFTVNTPNAVIGVKFSQPDVEVSYNPDTLETVGIAHTMELMAKNLLTDEEVLVPVGSSVIIVGTTIKIVAGIISLAESTRLEPDALDAESSAAAETAADGILSGMGTGTKIAIGAGAVAAIGGVVAITGGGDDGNNSGSSGLFTGTFIGQVYVGSTLVTQTIELTQNGTSLTGTFTTVWDTADGPFGEIRCISSVRGIASGTSATFESSAAECRDNGGSWQEQAENARASLVENGTILRLNWDNGETSDFIRQ